MLALYLGTAACGVVLVVVSMLLGGGDADADLDVDADVDLDMDVDVDMDVDADVDFDADVDADADVDHGHGGGGLSSWLPLASARFWTFLVMTFGLTGTGLTLLGVPWVVTLVISLVVGAGLGWLAAMLFRTLLKDRVSADTGLSSVIGREGKVVLPVRDGARGKIAVDTLDGRIEMIAVTGDGRDLDRGERILVADVRDGVADVTSLEPRRVGARKALTEGPS